MKWMDGRMHLLHLKYLGGSLAGPLDPLIEGSHFYISKNLMPKCISIIYSPIFLFMDLTLACLLGTWIWDLGKP